MGKKKTIVKDQAELIRESEAVEAAASAQAAQTTKQRLDSGKIYIHTSFNNTMLTVTNDHGGVVAWMSAGSLGFSGPKKATPFAASKVAEAIAEKVKRSGPMNVEIVLRGIGKGRDSAMRTLTAKGFNITGIRDMTPIPHNGPRPRKVRRV